MLSYGKTSKHQLAIASSILIGVLLILSSFAARPVSAATPSANPSVTPGQWVGSEGVYPTNWDYSNQTQIGASNVNQLQVSWVYPTPPTPSQYLAYNKFTIVPIGITFTGSMVNGIVYTMTQYMLIQASNAHTGALIWQAQLPNMKFNCMSNQIPVAIRNQTGHFHSMWYTSGVKGVWANTPMIWVMGSNHTAFAYNALTGSMLMHWQTYNPCATFANGATGVPGNFGLYDTTTQNAVIDTARGILVTGTSVSEWTDAGRCAYFGYDITVNPPKLLWTTFCSPPQNGSDPNWDISDVQNMTNAWIWDATTGTDVNLKTLPASQLQTMLYDDWGYASGIDYFAGHSWAGLGTSWGGNWAMDPATGNAFVATSEPSDFPNQTLRPGPNLWSEAVLSINDQTGTINWAHQIIPHDAWDVDCSWTDMFATLTVNGQATPAVIKSCKSGDFMALSESDGSTIWHFFPGPSDIGFNGNPSSVCSGAGSCMMGYAGAGHKAVIPVPAWDHFYSPLNRTEMTKGWPNAPSVRPFEYYPNGGGPTENNGAYDPTTNMVFYNTYSRPGNSSAGIISGSKGMWGGNAVGNIPTAALDVTSTTNDTVWALNANTGSVIWSHWIPQLGLRGGVGVTNGMVIVPLDNGSLLFLNEHTGTLLRNLFVGSAMVTQPIIGTDANGDTQIVLPAEIPITAGLLVSTYRTTSTSGFLFGVGLGPTPTTQTITSTSTSTATSTVTGPATTSVSTSISTSTVTSTAPGGTSTVTSTAPGATSTATVVSTTGTTGIDPTTFYAVAALAVIFVIVSGFLAMRGRKPAS
jgi:hypothetical protein